MDSQGTRAKCQVIQADIQKRVKERAKAREVRHEAIEKIGVLAAAGMASAVQRTAHMSVREGCFLEAVRTELPGGKVLESIIGIDDSTQVNFLPRGVRAARAVCRLCQGPDPIGTGFLIAPGIIMTNNHVIGSSVEATGFVAEFDYELDVDDELRSPVVRFTVRPDKLFVTSDFKAGLDFTIVAIEPISRNGGERITTFGHLPLEARTDKILEGEPTVILQHPRGNPKRLCLFAAELVDRTGNYLHYTTDTDAGASGSPVMNSAWQLVGLHHASVPGSRRRGNTTAINEGIRISSIIASLKGEAKLADGSPVAVQGDREAALAAIQAPDVVGDGRPQGPPIAIAPGAPVESVTPATAGVSFERTKIRTLDPDHFDGRPDKHFGYKENFLSIQVPMPSLGGSLASDIAKPSGGGTVLKYTHYSVIHSKSRKIPIVTAVNIDGDQLQKRKRTERDFEAADVWYYDPRLPSSVQLEPAVYDRTDFDFGHMVRREDPIWGDDNTATMANDDTFYMTNCAPQHHDLNTKTWLKLENAALASARENQMRVSVFTGPVLSPTDPRVLGVQVPTAFWKIVAWNDNGQLRARGFMQWQTKLVSTIRVRPESLDELEAVEEYEISIREIAKVTHLDFGPLEDADELGVTPEGLPQRRPLRSAAIDRLISTSGAPALPTAGRLAALGEVNVALPQAWMSDPEQLDAFIARLQQIRSGLNGKSTELVEN